MVSSLGDYIKAEKVQQDGTLALFEAIKANTSRIRAVFLFAWDEPVDTNFGLLCTNCIPRAADGHPYTPVPGHDTWDAGFLPDVHAYVPTGKPILGDVAQFIEQTCRKTVTHPVEVVLRNTTAEDIKCVKLRWRGVPSETTWLHTLQRGRFAAGKVVWPCPGPGGANQVGFRCVDLAENYSVRACWSDGAASDWIDLVPGFAHAVTEGDNGSKLVVTFKKRHQPGCEITDLGAPWARDINNNGDVLFEAEIRKSGIREPIAGRSLRVADFTASAFNECGLLCGTGCDGQRPKTISGRNYHTRLPYVWQNQRTIFLDLPGLNQGYAFDVNDAGQVVGYCCLNPDPRTPDAELYVPFVWANGDMTRLPVPDQALAAAIGINNRGEIVGWMRRAEEATHAVLWSRGKLTDLGTLGGESSRASKINDKGEVIGCSMTEAKATHAFIWQDGVLRDLGTLGGRSSEAYDINNSGWVIGESSTQTGKRHAFLWRDGMMTDLNDCLGTVAKHWSLETAQALNDQGQIVGMGRFNGEQRAYRLTLCLCDE